jgi:hypothetical protein
MRPFNPKPFLKAMFDYVNLFFDTSVIASVLREAISFFLRDPRRARSF